MTGGPPPGGMRISTANSAPPVLGAGGVDDDLVGAQPQAFQRGSVVP
jgi:hypothetical protein